MLPEALRAELAEPFGPVVQDDALKAALAGAPQILLVGDVVSLHAKGLGVKPKLFVCDYKTQRRVEQKAWRDELGAWGRVGLSARNPAGSITAEAWDAVRRALWVPESPVRIAIDGEEDLLAIPCFLEARDGAKVVYGLPERGAVVVTVDAALRERVGRLLSRFDQS